MAEQAVGIVVSGADDGGEPKVRRIRNYRRYVKNKLAARFPQILDKLVAESLAGSLAHTKFLFEIGGLGDELGAEGQEKGEPNLGDLFVNEVKRQNAEAARLAAVELSV